LVINARLYELKLAEIELERELVEKRKHSDYMEKQEEFFEVKEQRLQRAKHRLEETHKSILGMFDAATKAAIDTMNVMMDLLV
jgi:hypothetical protein